MPAVLTVKSQTEHTVYRLRNVPVFALLHLAKKSLLNFSLVLNNVKRLKNLMLLLLSSFSIYLIKLNPRSQVMITAVHILVLGYIISFNPVSDSKSFIMPILPVRTQLPGVVGC